MNPNYVLERIYTMHPLAAAFCIVLLIGMTFGITTILTTIVRELRNYPQSNTKE